MIIPRWFVVQTFSWIISRLRKIFVRYEKWNLKVVRDVRYQKMTRQVGAFFIKPWSSIESFRHSFVSICLPVCVCVSFNMFFVFEQLFCGRHKRSARSRKKKLKKKTQWKTHVWNADSMKKTSWGCKLRNMVAKKYKKGKNRSTTIWDATNESREKRNAVQQLLYILFIF